MRSPLIDGRLQVTAAASLLKGSRLVELDSTAGVFREVPREAFEFSWRHDVDRVFGRLTCWILFAAGAEFLAKGVCLIRNVEIRTSKEVPAYPDIEIAKWAPEFLRNSKKWGAIETTDFGTLGSLTYENRAKNVVAPLSRLCEVAGATKAERDLVLASYRFLTNTIRNRDAHAYVPNVRDSHHWLVQELFAPCLSLLVAWLPGGPQQLVKWRAESPSVVAALGSSEGTV